MVSGVDTVDGKTTTFKPTECEERKQMELAEKERIGGEVGRGRNHRSGGAAVGAIVEGEVRRSSRARIGGIAFVASGG